MDKAKKFILKKPFNGEPRENDFTVISEELPPLGDDGMYQFPFVFILL